MDYLKTVETNTEPTFILTNDVGDSYQSNGAILMLAYWYQGDAEEAPPKVTLDSDGVIYLERDDIKKLITALEEFL